MKQENSEKGKKVLTDGLDLTQALLMENYTQHQNIRIQRRMHFNIKPNFLTQIICIRNI